MRRWLSRCVTRMLIYVWVFKIAVYYFVCLLQMQWAVCMQTFKSCLSTLKQFPASVTILLDQTSYVFVILYNTLRERS